ncbi:MAG: hypothetical protein A2734_02855 [Parcubacteria group bacterium RIFCSPHIGHO2_01_FULL_40_30]|nr:MAG: hypothetical protein A2734_02855 [Parcubacteria group bacterium RIFCSPHIGHO2_01_FULL_40_30]OHB23588.1 MAG: hypothetical protein A3I22_02995 [Parcubacteria group bacterium RIFCSPLOWO2_02_FULL_40_12]
MLDKSLVEEKFKNIREYLTEIEEILKDDEKDIEKDFRSLRTLERNFQLIVDEIIDINMHLIRELELKTADDFQSTFRVLAESGILPYDFAEKIAPVVGLRNMLIHRYEKVEKRIFINHMREEYGDFTQYMKYVDEYLKTRQNS